MSRLGSRLPASRTQLPTAFCTISSLSLTQNFSNAKSVVEIILPDEEIGTDDGGAALARIGGAGELVKNFAGLPGEVASHHIGGAAVHQVPCINFVMTPDVKIEELLALGLGCCLGAGFPVHDADGANAHGMMLAVQQLFNFRGRHVDEFLGQGKNFPHGNTLGLAQAFGKFIGAQFFLGNGWHGATFHGPRNFYRNFFGALIRPVGHLLPFAALTGEGDNLTELCLLPSKGWEKVADRPEEGPFECHGPTSLVGISMRENSALSQLTLGLVGVNMPSGLSLKSQACRS